MRCLGQQEPLRTSHLTTKDINTKMRGAKTKGQDLAERAGMKITDAADNPGAKIAKAADRAGEKIAETADKTADVIADAQGMAKEGHTSKRLRARPVTPSRRPPRGWCTRWRRRRRRSVIVRRRPRSEPATIGRSERPNGMLRHRTRSEGGGEVPHRTVRVVTMQRSLSIAAMSPTSSGRGRFPPALRSRRRQGVARPRRRERQHRRRDERRCGGAGAARMMHPERGLRGRNYG